jgi:virginiamycin A acetyltransferase
MKYVAISILRILGLSIVLIPAILCKIEEKLFSSEYLFNFWGEIFALFPGVPGAVTRCIYYKLTVKHCSMSAYLSFGVSIAHRETYIGDRVIISGYTTVGRCQIGEGTGIGGGCRIISGRREHSIDSRGVDFSLPMKRSSIKIGKRVWIGDGSIIMADVGDGSVIGAGSVVTKPIGDHSVAVGNPARIIRRVDMIEEGEG